MNFDDFFSLLYFLLHFMCCVYKYSVFSCPISSNKKMKETEEKILENFVYV